MKYTDYSVDIGSIGTYAGMKVIVSEHAVERKEDWSKVRSPSRARRRMKQGHKQNVVVEEVPAMYILNEDQFVIHPDVQRKLHDAVRKKFEETAWHAISGKYI